MSYPVYQVPAGDVLPIFFDTFAGATGASITMTGLAVTDIEVYKDGGATQRASDAGFALLDTDGIDFDGITGIHGFSIDTGDNTDAGFYTVGAWFTVVVSAVTVDTQTVSFIAAMFRIMAAEGVAGVPDVNVTHLADTAQSPGDIFGEASDALPSLPTLASYLDTEIAAIKAKTDLLPAAAAGASGGLLINGANTGALSFGSGVTISNAAGDALTLSSSGGNGNGLSASGNGSGDGIHSVAGATGRGIHAQGGATSGAGFNASGSAGNANGITASGFGSGHGIAATGGATGDGVHALGGATSGAGLVCEARGGNSNGLQGIGFGTGVDLAADNLAAASDLATVAGYLDTEIAAIKAVTDKLDTMLENSSDGWIWTIAALQQAPAGGTGLDAAGVRAAIGLASANLDTQLAAIDTKTTNLPTDPADQSLVIAATDAIMTRLGAPAGARVSADIAALPTAAENATAVMASTIEGTFDLTESARLWNAALAGKASGLATATATFRDLADGKDRIVATVDADGNRTAVTRDVT